jgi:HEAT repeat protein
MKACNEEETRKSVIDILESFELELVDYDTNLTKLKYLDRQITVHTLQEMLGHPNDKLRYYASDMLLELEPGASLEALLPLLQDHDKHLRYNLCTKLCYFGNSRAVDALIHVLNKDQSSDVRLMAAVALGRIGDPRAVLALQQAVTDDFECDFQGEPISYAAARAIQNIINTAANTLNE